MKKFIPFGVLVIVIILALVYPSIDIVTIKDSLINSGDTAWLLVSTALVLIMTPGLAFFYGGMVSKKNVLSTMMQSFVCMGVITIIWVIFGFSLAFGDDIGGIVGNPKTFFMMKGMLGNATWKLAPTIPLVLFAMFQLKFAVITPALITGAFAERIRFNSYIIFLCLFMIVIYAPLAHSTWHPDGILFKLGVLDFAGGTVVHMSAGWAALASALYLKQRHDKAHAPARISYVLLGTGLLWFGWFGFNAGSALGANALAATALGTTTTASAAAAISWIFFDMARGKKPSVMGACIGAVVGLVAITPAAGYVSIPHSLIVGIVAAVVSNLVVIWRSSTSIDDTLDVFPCHGVGGMVGMLMTGIFGSKTVNSLVVDGQFLIQLKGMALAVTYSFIVAFIIFKVINLILPMRVTQEEEAEGLDASQHNEKYLQGTLLVHNNGTVEEKTLAD